MKVSKEAIRKSSCVDIASPSFFNGIRMRSCHFLFFLSTSLTTKQRFWGRIGVTFPCEPEKIWCQRRGVERFVSLVWGNRNQTKIARLKTGRSLIHNNTPPSDKHNKTGFCTCDGVLCILMLRTKPAASHDGDGSSNRVYKQRQRSSRMEDLAPVSIFSFTTLLLPLM